MYALLQKMPEDTKKLNPKQGNINNNIRLAGIINIVTIYLGYNYLPFKSYKFEDVGERLAFALQWQTLSIGTLLFGVWRVANGRFYSRAYSPLSGDDQDKIAVHLRYLSNTLEQFIIFIIGQLILTTYLSDNQMKLVPILAVLFVIGRITFWIGYMDPSEGNTNRAFGFALNFTINVWTWFYLVYRLVAQLIF